VLPSGPTLRHVLVVGVDGVRFDLLGPEVTPVIWGFGRDGFLGPVPVDETTPTWSGPCWATIATGHGVDGHGITGNDLTGHRLADHPDFVTLATLGDVTCLDGLLDGLALAAPAATGSGNPGGGAAVLPWSRWEPANTGSGSSSLRIDSDGSTASSSRSSRLHSPNWRWASDQLPSARCASMRVRCAVSRSGSIRTAASAA